MRPAVVLALAVTVSIAPLSLAAPVTDIAGDAAEVNVVPAAPVAAAELATVTLPLAPPAEALGHVEGELAGAATNTLIVAEPGTIALLGLGLAGLGLARRRAAREKHPRS